MYLRPVSSPAGITNNVSLIPGSTSLRMCTRGSGLVLSLVFVSCDTSLRMSGDYRYPYPKGLVIHNREEGGLQNGRGWVGGQVKFHPYKRWYRALSLSHSDGGGGVQKVSTL